MDKEINKESSGEPLISIIIPIYNVESYLPQCLESVCGQTWKNIEIILVDDGSTDSSGAICDEWRMKDSRVKVVHKKNGGVSSARNEGMKCCSGDYIGFVDGDDWIKPEMFEKLIFTMGKSDMACCGYVDYPMDSMDFNVLKGIKPSKPCSPIDAAFRIYERDGYFTAVWNKLYRKSAIMDKDDYIQMDESLAWGEDELWLAQVLNNCKQIAFLPEPLYHWRPTMASATRNSYVTNRQMTLLTSKQKAMAILPQDERLQELVKARMFNDCYSLKVLAYIAKDWINYKKIDEVLRRMKPAWIRSKDSSFVRKIKVQIMEIEMVLKLPGRIVRMTNGVRRYGVKW